MKKYYIGFAGAGVLVLFCIIGLILNPQYQRKYLFYGETPPEPIAAGDIFIIVGLLLFALALLAAMIWGIYQVIFAIRSKIKKGSDKLC
jgi:hypothetical protein